jgi:hypothetical protein
VSEFLGEFEVTEHEYSAHGPAEWALEFISRYGYIDGAHHKQWALDQAARCLLGTPVVVTEARWADGQKELRFRTSAPPSSYIDWLDGLDPDEDEVSGIAP